MLSVACEPIIATVADNQTYKVIEIRWKRKMKEREKKGKEKRSI